MFNHNNNRDNDSHNSNNCHDSHNSDNCYNNYHNWSNRNNYWNYRYNRYCWRRNECLPSESTCSVGVNFVDPNCRLTLDSGAIAGIV